jgi:uncharacterized protein
MTTLVLAICGRRLAQAAKRAGAEIVVADLFGDVDTRSLAPWHQLPGSLEGGIDGKQLIDWAGSLKVRPGGIVYGAGFEGHPDLLRELGQIAPLVGNSPEVVAAIKDPFAFATLLKHLDLPHPEVAASPRPGTRWLRKRRGGSGGTHIAPATSAMASPGHYFQMESAGSAISALFVANGRAARVLGLSTQWTAPTLKSPYRYGGCAGPVRVAPKLAAEIERACLGITAESGLVGLNSLDMLVEAETFTILEVNPRPGATLDLFDDTVDATLWERHLAGVRGELPAAAAANSRGARAAMVVYADEPRRIPASLEWGAGIADIPSANSHISAGMPICTVMTAAGDAATARALAERRAAVILDRLPLALQQSA